jgi:hypothetical protein
MANTNILTDDKCYRISTSKTKGVIKVRLVPIPPKYPSSNTNERIENED